MTAPLSSGTIAALREARAEEKAQTLFYRRLAGLAEAELDAETAERLNGLLADEQHHLSRLTARLLELGEEVADLRDVETPEIELEPWEAVARERERREIERYEAIAGAPLDEHTAELIDEILEAERQHERSLGGKWMQA